jgi:hypothetical protein
MKTTVAKRLLIALILVFLTALIVPVHAQAPAGACYDPDRTSGECPKYMQVVNVDMATSSGNYVATITLTDIYPSSLPNPNYFIEWNILIDTDRSNLTNPWGPQSVMNMDPHIWTLMDFENDIGADYRVLLAMQGTAQSLSMGIQNLRNDTYYPNTVQIAYKGTQQGFAMMLTFAPSSIGGAANFDFVVAVREYAKAGDPNTLMKFDKAPNVGHYSFVGGELHVVPEFPVATPILFTIILLATVLFFTRKHTKTSKPTCGGRDKILRARIPVTTRFCASCGGKQD